MSCSAVRLVVASLVLAACDPAPEPGDVGIQNLEITQGVQNLANQVPLLAGKATFVRVYVRGNPEGGAAVPAVTATMTVDGGAALAPIGTASVVAPAGGSDPRSLADSFTFAVPAASLTAGRHRVHVELVLPAGAAVSDPDNLVSDFEITLGPTGPVIGEPITMKVFGLRYGYTNIPPEYQTRLGLPSSTWPARPFADFEAQRDGAEQMLPVASLVIDPTPSIAPVLLDCAYDPETGGCKGYVDARTWGQQQVDAMFPGGGETVVVMQPETTPGAFLGAHFVTPRGNHVINFQPDTASDVGATLAHELYHALGIGHTATGLDFLEMNYPRLDGSMGPYVGLRSRPALQLFPGDDATGTVRGFDIMSYQFPQWASPWTYCRGLATASRGTLTCPPRLDDWDRR